MLQNRLRILMAERGLKITQLAEETQISRNTIAAIAYNKTKMIRLDVLNTLLKRLNVTPNDFFNFEGMHESLDLAKEWEEK